MLELQDIVRAWGAAYAASHGLSPIQRQVLQAVGDYRTSVLGGHVDARDACGMLHVSYNSCRNGIAPSAKR